MHDTHTQDYLYVKTATMVDNTSMSNISHNLAPPCTRLLSSSTVKPRAMVVGCVCTHDTTKHAYANTLAVCGDPTDKNDCSQCNHIQGSTTAIAHRHRSARRRLMACVPMVMTHRQGTLMRSQRLILEFSHASAHEWFNTCTYITKLVRPLALPCISTNVAWCVVPCSGWVGLCLCVWGAVGGGRGELRRMSCPPGRAPPRPPATASSTDEAPARDAAAAAAPPAPAAAARSFAFRPSVGTWLVHRFEAPRCSERLGAIGAGSPPGRAQQTHRRRMWRRRRMRRRRSSRGRGRRRRSRAGSG